MPHLKRLFWGTSVAFGTFQWASTFLQLEMFLYNISKAFKICQLLLFFRTQNYIWREQAPFCTISSTICLYGSVRYISPPRLHNTSLFLSSPPGPPPDLNCSQHMASGTWSVPRKSPHPSHHQNWDFISVTPDGCQSISFWLINYTEGPGVFDFLVLAGKRVCAFGEKRWSGRKALADIGSPPPPSPWDRSGMKLQPPWNEDWRMVLTFGSTPPSCGIAESQVTTTVVPPHWRTQCCIQPWHFWGIQARVHGRGSMCG